jgi:hypothetical protein
MGEHDVGVSNGRSVSDALGLPRLGRPSAGGVLFLQVNRAQPGFGTL